MPQDHAQHDHSSLTGGSLVEVVGATVVVVVVVELDMVEVVVRPI